jgi:hypothetical protein
MLIHKKIKPDKSEPKFQGLGGFDQKTHVYTPLTKENIESIWVTIGMAIQEGEMSLYAYGWKQVVPIEMLDEFDVEWVPIFKQDFQNYCNNLEKTILLPFNFL